MGLHAQFQLTNRLEIEAEIERLIALLDTADAPLADLEDDDPSGGNILDEPHDAAFSGGHLEGILRALPAYSLDQSAGPSNYRQASQEHEARERGLVRTATGWRAP